VALFMFLNLQDLHYDGYYKVHARARARTHARTHAHTHTHNHLTVLCPGLPGWPVAMYSCESWTLRKNEETHLDAFEMKELRLCGFHGQQRKQMREF